MIHRFAFRAALNLPDVISPYLDVRLLNGTGRPEVFAALGGEIVRRRAKKILPAQTLRREAMAILLDWTIPTSAQGYVVRHHFFLQAVALRFHNFVNFGRYGGQKIAICLRFHPINADDIAFPASLTHTPSIISKVNQLSALVLMFQ